MLSEGQRQAGSRQVEILLGFILKIGQLAMKQSDTTVENTIELRSGVFEVMSKRNVERHGQFAGFFHSIGRAIQGQEINNEFMKANQRKQD